MGMMINRRRVCGGKKGLLPSGYVQLEYIESTGTQYIDTGIRPDTSYNVDIVFITPNTLTDGSLFGNQNSDVLIYHSGKLFNIFNNDINQGTLSPEVSVNTKYSLNLSVNGNTAKITGDFTGTFRNLNLPYIYNIFLGANHGVKGNITDFGSFKYIIAKISNNGTAVRNYIPCKNPNNVVGMYDTVNGVFYSSPNGTAFVAGPEV